MFLCLHSANVTVVTPETFNIDFNRREFVDLVNVKLKK